MNPYYLRFCRIHGRTPEEQHTHDEAAWPGGISTGFILWMSQQERTFHKAHPEAFFEGRCGAMVDYEAWDRWLEATTTKLDDTPAV